LHHRRQGRRRRRTVVDRPTSPSIFQSILREGWGEFRQFVNAQIALRVELSGEPYKAVRTEGGRMIDVDGRAIEAFHASQSFGHRLPGVNALAFGDLAALEATLATGEVAAIVVEPIQLEGGVRPLPPDYLAALCELTAKSGALLVADEVQTGMGRTGGILK